MPTLITEDTVTARKTHACKTCDATAIQPGERYSRQTYVYDGRIYNWVQCLDCRGLSSMVWDWSYRSDEGIGRDDYVEWAREHCDDNAHGDAARAYLDRIGENFDPHDHN